MSSTGIAPTPSIRESQNNGAISDVALQREQGWQDALRTAASLRGTEELVGTSTIPSQVVVTIESTDVGGLDLEGSDNGLSSRQVPVGLIAPNVEGYIWPGHPNA